MKVLHVISGGDTGGAKTHVFALLDALKHMAEVKIVCLMPGAFYDEIRARGVEAVLLAQKNRLDMSVVSRMTDIIKKEKFDIVHAHGARANFIVRKVKKKMRIPVITTVHSDYRLDFDGIYRKVVYTGLNVLALRSLDYYIAVSSDFRNMLISRKFRPNRIFTVYNGMDYSGEFHFDDKETFAKRIGVDYNPDHIYVGLIGRHDYVKGHDVFIKAAARAAKENPNLRFLIAGDGDGRDGLVRLAEEVGIGEKLIFTGFIRDIYSFINFIDINTLSSRSESFPYVLLEGARMKKPTISAAVGGIPDLIADGETGCLFPAENDTVFAQKIIELAGDAEKRQRLGEALYARATGTFSNENLARSHVQIYEMVCKDYYSKKKYDVVLSGYYGFHNSGDDALLQAILDNLKSEKPDIRPLVLSARPRETEKLYGIDAVHRFNLPALYHNLGKSYVLINGGGSLLQDETSSKSLWYYLSVMKIARKRKAAVCIYANGIGPLRGKNRLRAAKAIEKAELVTLRDAASLEEIRNMPIADKKISVTADPALSLGGIDREEAVNILREKGIPTDKQYLGISLREWPESDKDFCRKIAMCVDYAVETYNLTPLFIPMKRQADSRIAQKLSEEMRSKLYNLGEEHGVSEVMGVIGECRMLLGMRLHALIYAASTGVPVIGLAYDPKVTGFMEYIGQDRICSITNVETEKICAHIDEICTKHEEIRTALMENAGKLCEKAVDNAKLCVELLEGLEKKK